MDKYSIFWFYMRNEFFDSDDVTDGETALPLQPNNINYILYLKKWG